MDTTQIKEHHMAPAMSPDSTLPDAPALPQVAGTESDYITELDLLCRSELFLDQTASALSGVLSQPLSSSSMRPLGSVARSFMPAAHIAPSAAASEYLPRQANATSFEETIPRSNAPGKRKLHAPMEEDRFFDPRNAHSHADNIPPKRPYIEGNYHHCQSTLSFDIITTSAP
ncbi:hypothetical protein BST61_g1113 [Cercospora zeina]